MALTKGGSIDVVNGPTTSPQGSPNKHIVGNQSASTANFGSHDTNASGEVPDASTGGEDVAAKAHTAGSAAPRVNEVARQASAATTGDGSGASVNAAFIDGSSLSASPPIK